MKRKFKPSLKRDQRRAVALPVALALSLAPGLAPAATGELVTNVASVSADNSDTETSNNVSGTSAAESVDLSMITNAAIVTSDNTDTNPYNDSGGSGLPDDPQDTDGDSVPDYQDLDDDNDGIPDTLEQATAGNGGDTDGDGIPDHLDLDSDNDGVLDLGESGQSTGLDADNDGRLDGSVGLDGVPDTVQTNPDTGGINYTVTDTDGDSHPDFQDLDSDNDGINDVDETADKDKDGDGMADGAVDPDGIPVSIPAGGTPPRDTDGDGVPDPRDLDSDNDSIPDVAEGGNGSVDTDGNGTIDPTEGGGDADGDGIPDAVDGAPGNFGDAGTPPPDTDSDGTPDSRDPDRDGDGIPDIVENGHGGEDSDNDGKIDNPADTDGDGIPDTVDTEPGDFGGAPPPNTTDTDGDGIPDVTDLDDDNDGIPDTVEDANALNGFDTDGDGVPDSRDLDSDNDGLPDAVEAGHGGSDANNDGRVDGPAGTNGLPDVVETTPGSGVINYTPRDTDGDGREDYIDLDSDNDGINDVDESGGTDNDGDGQADGPVNPEGVPGTVPPGGTPPRDTDGDGIPDNRDLDSDNDSIPDVVEGGNGAADTNGNGTIDPTEGGGDTDGDGIPDNADGDPGNFGDTGTPPPDTDTDGTPDYRDPDSDGDGFPDIVENGHGGQDTDDDGKIDDPTDSDGDGIPDTVDTIPGGFGGAPDPIPVDPTDTDSDGIPDVFDLDDDNDGIPDTVEEANAGNGGDTDGDGVPDSRDLDSDNDGIPDLVEAGHSGADSDLDGRADGPAGTDGIPDSVQPSGAPNGGGIDYTPRDTDNDGTPDYLDLDSDNDSISDLNESGNGAVTDDDHNGAADGPFNSDGLTSSVVPASATDTDSDGTPDYRDTDSNGDGINDIVDNGFSGLDTDGDGRIDNDDDASDSDGIPDILDTQDGTFGGFPLHGCAAWNSANLTDPDGDVFPKVQEYAFGGSTASGVPQVEASSHRQGLSTVKNATGGVDVSLVRPQGRFDVSYTLYGSTDLVTWTPVAALPLVIPNGDTTDTLVWRNAQLLPQVSAARGFVRLSVSTPCQPAESHTLVQGWTREDVAGSRQTYGVNFTSAPVFTGKAGTATGSTLTTPVSGAGLDLSTLLAEPGATYYVEFTDGVAEGQRYDLSGGGTGSLTLDLASPHNTSATVPPGIAGSAFVIRRHRTLGEVFVNAEWKNAFSAGSADQVLVYDGNGYVTYFNYTNPGGSPFWAKSGAGAVNQNSTVIPPGAGIFVVHAQSSTVNDQLQTGDVRYNDFLRPVTLGTSGLNFVAQGYPLDASPGSLNMTTANGFTGASSPGSATIILNWNGDSSVNALGYTTNYLLPGTLGWVTQGNAASRTTNSPLFLNGRGAFVQVRKDNTGWIHSLPWDPVPWVQP